MIGFNLTAPLVVVLLFMIAGCSSRTLKSAPTSMPTPKHTDDELHPLFQAVGQNKIKDVEVLIKQGLPVNSVNSLGVSPLMLASFKGLDQVVSYLLSQGADPNLGDNKKTTAMHYASQKGNASSLRLLIENGGKVENIDTDGFTPLHLSVRFGSLASTSLLLKNGSDANVKDALGTPVMFFAVMRGNKEQVRLLIEHGAIASLPDADDLTALTQSIEIQNKDVFDVLLQAILKLPPEQRGPLADFQGNTSVHYAAIVEDAYFLKELVRVQAEWPLELNFQNKEGVTPAMWAASKRNREQLEILLNEKINTDLVDQRGWDLREYLLSKDFSETEVDNLLSAENKK